MVIITSSILLNDFIKISHLTNISLSNSFNIRSLKFFSFSINRKSSALIDLLDLFNFFSLAGVEALITLDLSDFGDFFLFSLTLFIYDFVLFMYSNAFSTSR